MLRKHSSEAAIARVVRAAFTRSLNPSSTAFPAAPLSQSSELYIKSPRIHIGDAVYSAFSTQSLKANTAGVQRLSPFHLASPPSPAASDESASQLIIAPASMTSRFESRRWTTRQNAAITNNASPTSFPTPSTATTTSSTSSSTSDSPTRKKPSFIPVDKLADAIAQTKQGDSNTKNDNDSKSDFNQSIESTKLSSGNAAANQTPDNATSTSSSTSPSSSSSTSTSTTLTAVPSPNLSLVTLPIAASPSTTAPASVILTSIQPVASLSDTSPLVNAEGWPIFPSGLPREPEPSTCCGNDCPNCVWIQYEAQMVKFREAQKERELRAKKEREIFDAKKSDIGQTHVP